MLSSMGGWLDAGGHWHAGLANGQSGKSLEAWRHIATMGRDHYVRVVRTGFLAEYGVMASLIKTTERKFRTMTFGFAQRRVAYTFQSYRIVVRQPLVTYGGPLQPHAGRAFPFTHIRFTTLITPNLDPPGDGENPPVSLGKTRAFVPKVGGKPFLFHVVGTDRAGRSIDFHTPVVFVDGEIAFTRSEMNTLRNWYNTLPVVAPERTVHFHGAKVAVADPAEPGSTDVELHRVTLGGEPAAVDPSDPSQPSTALVNTKQPDFFPTIAEAEIRLAAAEAAVGAAIGLPVITFNNAYVTDGLDAWPGEVFADLKGSAALDFRGQERG